MRERTAGPDLEQFVSLRFVPVYPRDPNLTLFETNEADKRVPHALFPIGINEDALDLDDS
jgi:hypothetical protein